MDYRKLDGALAAMLDDRANRERLSVFVRTQSQLPPEATSRLKEYGIDAGDGMTVLSGDLSPEQVDALSEQPWVTSIRLARIARPLSNR
jgi:hypothetical protein